jgi:acyl dehydratase
LPLERKYPPVGPYLVGREKIREFADAIGASDRAHRDLTEAQARGYPDLVAPPTFPIVVTLASGRPVFEDPEFGLDFSRVVHGQQRFRYARPVFAGDELTGSCILEDVISRGGSDFVSTRTEVTAPGGEPVLTAWAKLVVRGKD